MIPCSAACISPFSSLTKIKKINNLNNMKNTNWFQSVSVCSYRLKRRNLVSLYERKTFNRQLLRILLLLMVLQLQ